jgi:activator of HSP90 ATPase
VIAIDQGPRYHHPVNAQGGNDLRRCAAIRCMGRNRQWPVSQRRTIHQEVSFSSSPMRIYEALTRAEQFQKVVLLSVAKSSVDVTSKPAEISGEPGGIFVIFGGYISGRQIELERNQRIVQAWHEREWAPGVYSIARFELREAGTGTKLIFDHTGFQAGAGDHLATGWKINYWEPLAKVLGEWA